MKKVAVIQVPHGNSFELTANKGTEVLSLGVMNGHLLISLLIPHGELMVKEKRNFLLVPPDAVITMDEIKFVGSVPSQKGPLFCFEVLGPVIEVAKEIPLTGLN